ncbi:MAG: peptidylprolyl isomerase [Acidobacteriota bacterium]
MPNSTNRIRCAGLAVAMALSLASATQPIVRAQSNSSNDDASQEVILDEIVAKVNTEIITMTDLRDEERKLRVSVDAQFQDPQAQQAEFDKQRYELLRNLILNKIIIQRAEELGMLANIENDVSSAVQSILQDNNIPDLDAFRRILQQQGTNYEEYRTGLRERYIIQAMQQQFVYSKVTILTEEVEQYYQENIDRFTELPEVRVAEILFLTQGKNKQAVRTRAEDLLARLRAGEAFEDLARQYSEGPTADQGGELGTFKQGQMAEKLEGVAFSLQQGQFSDWAEMDYGLVILKLLSKKEARPRPLEEVRDEVSRILQAQKVGPYLKTFLDDLIAQSYVYISSKYRGQFNLKDL